MKVLFDNNGNPYPSGYIGQRIKDFGYSYNQTVDRIIKNSDKGLDKTIFWENIATLFPNFKMTRKGRFQGIKIDKNGIVHDKNGVLDRCWKEIGDLVLALREFLDQQKKDRNRILVEMNPVLQVEVSRRLWEIFKTVVPVCMGETTFGLVGPSKILFANLPEVALPIDNNQWLRLFKTIDYGDIFLNMAKEISDWEERSDQLLNDCNAYPSFTLPAVYNVMAMDARPLKI